MADAQA